MEMNLDQINNIIYIIRGQKVMLDSDLANLYGVETKQLNRQVRRNNIRFPDDFMFELNKEEFENLKCQNGTSSSEYGGRRKQPLVFTENGVAMLSSVLKSEQAALVNIAIMRIFTKLRSFHLLEKDLVNRVDQLGIDTTEVFKVVFERLDKIENLKDSMTKDRVKIGINRKD
jgi:hypothetical protein